MTKSPDPSGLPTGASGDASKADLLHAAVRSGDVAAIAELIQSGEDLGRVDGEGLTPLHRACRDQQFAIAEGLMAARAAPNVTAPDGTTPLVEAVGRSNEQLARLLLGHGADPNVVGEGAPSALTTAAVLRHRPLVELLLGAGADPNRRDPIGSTPLTMAAALGEIPLMETLVRHGADVREEGKDGPPLAAALRNARGPAAVWLLAHGADPTRPTEGGWTPLLMAAWRGVTPVVSLLLEVGVAPDAARTTKGATALIVAAAHGHPNTVRVLLAAGADPCLAGGDGITALGWAERMAYRRCQLVLLEDPRVRAAVSARSLQVPTARATLRKRPVIPRLRELPSLIAFRWGDRVVVEGCSVGLALVSKNARAKAAEHLGEALRLIARTRPRVFATLRRDLRGLLVAPLPGVLGSLLTDTRLCALDEAHVLDPQPGAITRLAATIIHEAVHARLVRLGFDYAEPIRARVERVCIKQELLFAERVSDGVGLRRERRQALLRQTSAYSNRATRERALASAEARKLVSPWLLRAVRWVALR